MRSFFVSALLLTIVTAWPAVTTAQPPASERVDALFGVYGNATPGCSVAVDRNDTALHVAGYGTADLEQGIAVRPETAFYAASVSKQFVAMSALLLQQQGKIDLDLPVRTYLPSLPAYADRVTTRQLLHHTGGVRDYFRLFALGNRLEGLVVTDSKIMEVLARQDGLSFEPGERYAYSNSAYFLISQIVKEVDGRNLNDFAQAHIFGPLEMEDSRFQHNHRDLVPRKAHGYAPLDEGGYLLADSTLDVVGSGGMYTTVLDLTKWARNFRDNQLQGGAGTIGEMQTVGKLNNGEETDYGLGIGVGQYRGLATRTHGGALEGYRTYLMMFPEQALSIAILCNDQKASTGTLARAIADIYLADEFTEQALEKEEAPLNVDALGQQAVLAAVDHGQYAGSYFSDEVDGTQTLTVDDDALVLNLGPRAIRLEHIDEDRFGFREYRFELEFARDESGKISGFTYNGSRAAGIFFGRLGNGN